MDKELAWLHGEIKTPPFSPSARVEAGYLLRRVQQGEKLELPQSRPMSEIFYRVNSDVVLILGVLDKKTRSTPAAVIQECRDRLKRYERESR